MSMRISIAGGGIGGLAAALFLHRDGIRATIYEAAGQIRELGVGINLQPHAIRELATLGLDRDVLAAGNPCENWGLYNEFGQEIWSEPRGLAAGESWPQVSIHRGVLQGLLLAAVRERLGADAVHTGMRQTGFDDRGEHIHAEFLRPDGSTVGVESDVLVGADGIHSRVRQQLYPREGQVRYSGQNMWRGVARTRPYLDGHTMAIIGHEEQKFVAYPITPAGSDGVALVNWIVELPEERPLAREDWNRTANVDHLADRFEHWRVPWLDVAALIRETETAFEFPMVDRDPLPQWTHGRVTLLGDAAHPMYPIGANGASQAIRDGSALGRALAAAGTTGLAAYEAERRPVTSEIVMSNRRLGPEAALQLAHLRAPEGFTRIEDVIPREEIRAVVHGYTTLTSGRAPSHEAATHP